MLSREERRPYWTLPKALGHTHLFPEVVIVAHRGQVIFPVPQDDEHGIRKDFNLILMIIRKKKPTKTEIVCSSLKQPSLQLVCSGSRKFRTLSSRVFPQDSLFFFFFFSSGNSTK